MIRRLLAGAATGIVAGSAMAAPTTTFTVNGGINAGYSSNPYLDENGHGTASLSGTVSPNLTVETGTSTTVIGGDATYLKYFNNYGDSRSLDAHISRVQSFSSTLSGSVQAAAADTTSALLNPFVVTLPVAPTDLPVVPSTGALGAGTPAGTGTAATGTDLPVVPVIGGGDIGLPAVPTDIIASRQRVRSYSASGGLTWQASAHDSFGGNAQVVRGVYPGEGHHEGVPAEIGLSDYWSYGGNLNYNRQLNARTTVGATAAFNRTDSALYPDGTSIEPGVTVTYKINRNWTANGSLGLILDTIDLPTGHTHDTELGFGAGLCGAYTRKSVCINVSRQTEPSGYGGLRTRLSASLGGSYQLDERSSLSANAGYARDEATDQTSTGSLSLIQTSLGYSRTLTRRLAFNASVGYQRDKYPHIQSGDGVSASVGLSISLGRNR